MSLFIGNLSRDTREKDIEDLFSPYGKCKINFKGTFAFAAFEEEKEAEKAKEELQSKKVCGREINVEWCKSKPRGERDRERERYKERDRDNDRDKGKCFNCNKYGHYARDCPESDSRRRFFDKRKSHGMYNRYKRSRSRSSRSRNNHYYSSHKRRWRDELERNDRNRSRPSSRNNRYNGRKRKTSDSAGGEKNSFGSKSRSRSISKNKSRSRNVEKDRDKDRDRDRDRERGNRYRDRDNYRNMNNRNKSNSRERYYDKKDKNNNNNNDKGLDDSWGCENEKVEDLKE